jgi:uncharacterized protein (DUF1778 family)
MPVRTERMDMRLSREEKRLIERAALMTGQPATSFVLTSALERAREALAKESWTVLTRRDWTAFVRMLQEAERAPGAPARAAKHARTRKE